MKGLLHRQWQGSKIAFTCATGFGHADTALPAKKLQPECQWPLFGWLLPLPPVLVLSRGKYRVLLLVASWDNL